MSIFERLGLCEIEYFFTNFGAGGSNERNTYINNRYEESNENRSYGEAGARHS